jgi:hypothetical protein
MLYLFPAFFGGWFLAYVAYWAAMNLWLRIAWFLPWWKPFLIDDVLMHNAATYAAKHYLKVWYQARPEEYLALNDEERFKRFMEIFENGNLAVKQYILTLKAPPNTANVFVENQ